MTSVLVVFGTGRPLPGWPWIGVINFYISILNFLVAGQLANVVAETDAPYVRYELAPVPKWTTRF